MAAQQALDGYTDPLEINPNAWAKDALANASSAIFWAKIC